MNDAIIAVEKLGKKYRISHQAERQRYVALRDVIAQKMKAPFQFLRRSQKSEVRNQNPTSDLRPPTSVPASQEDFWALKDVSFEVKRGEVLGIIGRNGAGKSTLLKILSRITEPTEGRVCIRGRVASLLEVGTGFHPELTGRENIFLNGAILGMSRVEIRRKFDEIVAFAEMERFLDTPVKRFSSGMYVRLAFAVAAHLEPEILIVDEVLAVGDAEFQKKCLGKMESVVRGEGRTVLFVSHNLAAIEALCSSAIVLSAGELLARGETNSMVQAYLNQAARQVEVALGARRDREGSGAIRFSSVELADGNATRVGSFQCGADATLILNFDNTSGRDLRNVGLSIGVDNELGQRVLLLDTTLLGQDFEFIAAGSGRIRIIVPRLCLLPGRYHITIYATVSGVIADWIKGAAFFDVEGGDYFGTGQLPPNGQGMFVTPHRFFCEPEMPDKQVLADKRKEFGA
ncbi:MAG: ABC transporter ATP-binding protein [Verrucomicrobiia bacterium]